MSCIQFYEAITEQYLQTFSGQHVDTPGWHALFWGEVLQMSPELLEQEQKMRWDDVSAPDAISLHPEAQWNWLDHGARIRFQAIFWPSDRTATDEARACAPGPGNEACQIRAYRAHCVRAGEAFNSMLDESEAMYDRAANRFDRVASATMLRGERELAGFHEYATKWFAHLKLGGPDAEALRAQGFDERQMYLDGVNQWWGALIERVVDPDYPTDGVAEHLREEAEWFTRDREQTIEYQASRSRDIEHSVPFGGCTAVEQRYLEILAQEAYEQYLQQLRDNLASNFQVGYNARINCNGTIGPLTLSLDESGDGSFSINFKNSLTGSIDEKIKYTIKDGAVEFGGATVGGGVGGAGGGIVGSGDYNVFVGKNPRTGKWDGGASFSGKLGIGAKVKRKVRGREVGLGFACYPGSVDAKFYARAAFDDAVKLVMADINRPSP
jgi:hypothetical protein